MSPPPVKIRIGGSIDQSLDTALKTAVQKIGQAEKTAQKLKRETTKATEDEAKRELRAQERLTKATESLDKQRSRGLFAAYRQQEAAAERAGKAEMRTRQRTEENARREIQKTVQAAMRALEQEERAQKRFSASQGRQFAERTSHRATRFLSGNSPILPMAGRALSSVASGAGVDFSVAGAVGRIVDQQAAAVALANRGHVPGAAGANGQVVSAAALQAEAQAAGKATAVNPAELLAAGQAFVGLTGDLDLWRKIMPEVAKQTAALGGNQEEAAKAAGEFAAHVGDVPNKEKAILDLMRVAGGQGKIGGVDFSDFAKYAAKAAAPASQFAGDKAQNISQLTALAEIAKMHGGASNAAEAFTSVASFSNTLNKPARRKSINALLGDQGQTLDNSDPFQLARALVLAASKKGDSNQARVALSAAVGDTRSLKAVRGLQNTFNEAGGGKAGTAAMDAELAKFRGAVMSAAETERANAEKLKTTQAKAELFNQQLQNVTQGVMEKLVPALDKAAPSILHFADIIGKVATWAIDNPKVAIASAITASIARAGLESTLRAGIERMLLGAGGKNASGLGAAVGKLGLAFTVVSMGVTTLQVGKALIDEWFVAAGKDQRDAVEKDVASTNASVEAQRLAAGGDLTGAKTKAEEAIKAKEEAINQTKETGAGETAKMLALVAGTFGVTGPLDAIVEQNKTLQSATDRQTRELADSKQHLADILAAIKEQGMPGGDNSGTGTRVSQ
jgi:hypothetical protein